VSRRSDRRRLDKGHDDESSRRTLKLTFYPACTHNGHAAASNQHPGRHGNKKMIQISHASQCTLSKADFANLLIKDLRESGETGTIEYDAGSFEVVRSNKWRYPLEKFYEALGQASAARVIECFRFYWRIVRVPINDNFADVKARLLPVVRPRSELEIDVRLACCGAEFTFPHGVIADHLVSTLTDDISEAPFLAAQVIGKWGVTYAEAMAIAMENLQHLSHQYVKEGELHSFISHDGTTTSGLLLSEKVKSLDVAGDLIAMLPNRSALFVCGSEDSVGLKRMADATRNNLRLPGSMTGMAFRRNGNEWEVWLPPEDHPTYDAFRELQLQSIAAMYSRQMPLLGALSTAETIQENVCLFLIGAESKTGRQTSVCAWTKALPALLPKTDYIRFCSSTDMPTGKHFEAAAWDTVQDQFGHMMKPQGMYPERWLVTEFPSESAGELAPLTLDLEHRPAN
jgi:hypothetical protein